MAQNIVNVHYASSGKSTIINEYGMREMQIRAFAARHEQYILLKAPPASGKSRALMFIALDKIKESTVRKVIVAVPERSIAGSFSQTDLKTTGFHSDWVPNSKYDLCTPGGDKSKVLSFKEFLNSDEKILICTHATLRFAFNELKPNNFNNCLMAIDEFHHVSADYESRLGELIRALISNSSAHILAMTGSYFRGDCVPVLMPEDEALFFKVTYNYYEQLNGYKYLKSLGIGYHFYQGQYLSAIKDVLDTNKKTILHIPNVNSGESTQDKLKEVDEIIDLVGRVVYTDPNTNILNVQSSEGKIIKIADLVNDNPNERQKTISFLRNITNADDIDIIIALGMAKEGFDWPFCEHALTVGYRGSLTEIIQIIGRCTRDSVGKSHAQFTNLVAEPDVDNAVIVESVNNMLKAITASLLMEQVLAPNFKFLASTNTSLNPLEIVVKGFKSPSSKRVQNIIDTDLTDLKATILQDNEIIRALPGNVDPEVINKILIPKVIKVRYPDLSPEEVEEVRQQVVLDSVLRHTEINQTGNQKFIQVANNFINIEDLDIDLIDRINPFQNAFEVISKSLTPRILKAVQQCISTLKINMTEDEAVLLWDKINEFVRVNRRKPSLDSMDPKERRLAEAVIYLRNLKRSQESYAQETGS